jgi:hypothetical protein
VDSITDKIVAQLEKEEKEKKEVFKALKELKALGLNGTLHELIAGAQSC